MSERLFERAKQRYGAKRLSAELTPPMGMVHQ